MGIIRTNYGQPSYTLASELADVFITVQGGHLTASFKGGGRDIAPFYVAPWWEESRLEDIDEVVNVLRGSFFGFPFGGNEEAYYGKKYPTHGQTANDNWVFADYHEKGGDKELSVSMELDDNLGRVRQSVRISDREPIIYVNNTVSEFDGKISVGYHPTIQLPEKVGSAILDMSDPVTGFTAPFPVEDPAAGGYSLLMPDVEVTDRRRVPCVNGTVVDLTRCPITKGFEDLVVFISDLNRSFSYCAVTFPEEGYLYFQLKNPKLLCQTLLWMSNGGRHYPPWNGRVSSVLGIEEVTSFFHYGIKPSTDANFLQEKGYKTFVDIRREEYADFRLIMGLIPIDRGFTGVKDIIENDESSITIIGRKKERIVVPCKVGFITP